MYPFLSSGYHKGCFTFSCPSNGRFNPQWTQEPFCGIYYHPWKSHHLWKNCCWKKCSRINLAESLPQQVSILANLSTLEQFFSIIIEDIFGSVSHINFEPVRSHLVGVQLEELDSCILFIQEASSQLRDCFCQKFIHRMMLLETGSTNTTETCNDDEHDLMPSVAFQVTFYFWRTSIKISIISKLKPHE